MDRPENADEDRQSSSLDPNGNIFDAHPYNASNWDQVVTDQIAQVKASGMINLAAYAIWNEPDGTWNTANGSFEDFWVHSYNLIRSLDPTTPIQGSTFSDNISEMENFLAVAKATNTMPDILAWHEPRLPPQPAAADGLGSRGPSFAGRLSR